MTFSLSTAGMGTNMRQRLEALADYVAEWGYDARITWENRRIGHYLAWPIVGPWLRRWLEIASEIKPLAFVVLVCRSLLKSPVW